MRGLLLLLLLLVSVFISGGSAAECKSSCDIGLTQCNIIDYDVYVTNETKAKEQDNSLATIFALAKAVAPEACFNSLKRLFCTLYFPSCTGNETVPQQSCSQMCYDVQTACNGQEKALPSPYLTYVTQCNNSAIYTLPDSPNSCTNLNTTDSNCGFGWNGTCQAFDPSLAPIAGAICAPYAPKIIYVAYDSPTAQVDIGTRADVVETARRIQNGLAIIPIGCLQRYASVLCPIAYPPCYTYEVLVENQLRNVSVAPTICKSFCYEAVDACRDFLETAGLLAMIPSCDSPSLVDIYTNGTTHVQTLDTRLNVTVEVPCYHQVFPDDPYIKFELPNVTCPLQMGKKTVVTDADAVCGMKCPDASYSNSEWRDLVALTQAGSAISLICMAFLIASYLVKYEKRKFPATLHLNEFAATFMFSLSFLLGGSHPEKNVWCFDEGTYATQKNNDTCAVQGFFFIFFGISLAAWCAVIAFTMFYTVVWKKTKNALQSLRKYNVVFYIFGWGIPLIFGIAALGAERVGYGPPLAWCFIRFGGFGFNDGFSRDYPLFYIPVGVLFVFIFIMFFATIFTIMNTRRKSTYAADNAVIVNAQIRVLIFIFVIVAICITLYEWRFQIEAENKQEDRLSVGFDWTYCKIKVALNLSYIEVDGDKCPGDVNPARINYNHTAFESFLLSGIGILIFIAFGSDIGIYKHWAKIARHLVNGEKLALEGLIVAGKDSSRTRTGTSNSNLSSSKNSKNSSANNKSSDSKNSDSKVSDPQTTTSVEMSGAGNEEDSAKSREIYEL